MGAMSTTNVQPLRSVRARMEYTRLGRGDMRRSHRHHGTDRIIGRLGDFENRGDFVEYCETVTAQAGRRVEGHEVRVSFDDQELRADRPEDVETALGHGYRLAKALAPDSPCDITAHGDGKGGMLHLHIAIANVDEATGRALAHGMNHKRVSALNDELAREWGLSVPGERSRSWAAKRKTADEFEQALGDRVAEALDKATDMESFRDELARRGIELRETRRRLEDGSESVGWSYRMRFTTNGRTRIRRRSASRLADEFTPEAVARRYEPQKQFGLKAPQAPTGEAPIEDADVAMALTDVRRARVRQLRSMGARITGDAICDRLDACLADRSATAEQLRKQVEDAREAFRRAKGREEYLAKHPTPWGYTSGLLSVAARLTGDPLMRMLLRYMGSLMAARDAERRRQALEGARAETYRARADMWSAEKRERAALGAISYACGNRRLDARTRSVIDKADELEAELRRQRAREADRQLGL